VRHRRNSVKPKGAIKIGDENPTERIVAPTLPPSPPWTVADAKARLSEVLDKARSEGPQIITRNGKKTAVVVGIEEWERKTQRKGTLVDFLLASPLRGSEVDLERSNDDPREISL
jgi:prevent-host-death family protein